MDVKSGAKSGEVQSVHRALSILETVGTAGDVGVSELAGQLGLAVSTVHNLVRTMSRRHYLIGSHGRYSLGPAAMLMTSQWDPTLSLPALVRPELQRVAEATGQAATATVLVGRDARLLYFEPAPGPVTASSVPWQRRNPLLLATGRLIVALQHADAWDEFITAGRDAEPDWTDAQWRDELAKIARTGICVKHAAEPQDQAAVALPVWAVGHKVVCALGCSTPAFLLTEDLTREITDVLRSATGDLSARLGCPDPPSP